MQEALGTGYLSAFPTEHFDRLRSLQAVWAPFYVVSNISRTFLTPNSTHGRFLDNYIAYIVSASIGLCHKGWSHLAGHILHYLLIHLCLPPMHVKALF